VGVSLACIIFLRLLLASRRSRLSRGLFELCPFHKRTGRFDAHAISRCVHERDSHEIIHRLRGPGSEGGRRLSFDQRYRDQTVETKIERGTMDRCIEREGDSRFAALTELVRCIDSTKFSFEKDRDYIKILNFLKRNVYLNSCSILTNSKNYFLSAKIHIISM